MISKRFTVLLPIVLTFTALIGLALGPGSQPALPESPTVELVSFNSTEAPSVIIEQVVTATPTDVPTPTLTSIPTATLTPIPRTATPANPTSTRVVSRTVSAGVRTARVPILMYHYVSVPPPDADKYRLDLSVTPEAFAAQVEYLAANGYHPIRLMDLADHLLYAAPLPDKPIVLTFDDGYADNYDNAFPVLAAHSFPATFFVITNYVEENRWGYLNWTQLEELVKAGMEIGSHTSDHPDLKGKPLAYQNAQLGGSKQMLSNRLGVNVLSFSYPAGKYDANTTSLLKVNGYAGAVTEIQGARQSSDAVYELQRIRMRGAYTIADFEHWLKYYTENGK